MAKGVLFVLIGGAQVFFKAESREVCHEHVRKYLKALEGMKDSTREAFLYGDDDEGNHVAMVRCSQVVGFMIIEEEEAWKR